MKGWRSHLNRTKTALSRRLSAIPSLTQKQKEHEQSTTQTETENTKKWALLNAEERDTCKSDDETSAYIGKTTVRTKSVENMPIEKARKGRKNQCYSNDPETISLPSEKARTPKQNK